MNQKRFFLIVYSVVSICCIALLLMWSFFGYEDDLAIIGMLGLIYNEIRQWRTSA